MCVEQYFNHGCGGVGNLRVESSRYKCETDDNRSAECFIFGNVYSNASQYDPKECVSEGRNVWCAGFLHLF